MILFLILLILYSTLSSLGLLEILAAQSIFLQNSCSAFFTSRLLHGDLASAFICGTPIHSFQVHEIFVQTGLLHLMVVSGSHLQMLSLLMSWLIPRKWKSIWLDLTLALLLMFYAFLSGFQPPVVRALVARLIATFSNYFRWGWDSGKITMASGFFLLALSPVWIFNFSFYLSWLACLGLTVPSLCLSKPWYQRRRARFLRAALHFWLSCFCVQTLMAVALFQFSFLGLLMNSLIAPIISCLLFPLSLSIIVIPPLHGWIDSVWLGLLQFLEFFSQFSDPTGISRFPTPDSWIFLWFFLAFIHAFFEFLQRFRYRGSSV